MTNATSEHRDPAASTILIVDDHPILRRGLAALIEAEADLTVCGEAASASEALAMITAKRPDLVLVDLTLEGSDGLDVIKVLQSRHPDVPALVLSMHDESTYAESSLRAGARGYVSKQQLYETVLAAIRCVLSGGTYMSDQLKARLAMKYIGGRTLVADPLDSLSDRELQVFRLIAHDLTTRKIATTLSLSVKTVETHIEHIKRKLGLKSAAELAQCAKQWIASGGND